jgi:hypothetical protein
VSEFERDLEQTDDRRFAPRDVPTPDTAAGLVTLFENCGIPSAFVDESLQGVSQSFAAQEDVDGTMFVWFHFLCKTLSIENNKIVPVQDSKGTHSDEAKMRQMAQRQSHANFSWMKPGFVLKIRKQAEASLKPIRTSTSDSNETLAENPAQAEVELFCFGAPSTLQDRFHALKTTPICAEVLQDPHLLLEIVFEEMYKIIDWTAWAISDVFGPSETVCGLARACRRCTNKSLASPRDGEHTWESN